MTHSWKDVIVKFDVLLTSNYLSIDKLSDSKRERHKIIMDLHDRGFSNKQISQYMKDRNILSPRGVEYYPKLIWVTRKKLKDREKRRKDYDVQIGRMRYYLKKEVIPYKVFKNDMV